jgi:fumarate hydratase class II
MPGKVNPVVAEAVNQVHARVAGNDATVAAGASRGQLDLNLYKPVLAHTTLRSVHLLTNAAETFAERFVARLDANEEACAAAVERSMALATALNPAIGYDKAATVAKRALAEDRTVREVAIAEGYLTAEEADEVLDPERMTHRGILGEE